MSDFLLELLSEEIPARMQAKARADLVRLFEAELAKSGLAATGIETYATPRRLALIARGLPLGTPAVSEELKGPRTSAPPQALEGFLRKTGLTQDQLTDRDGIWFAVIEKPGRATTEVLAEAIPAIVRAFPWPKSMRWGAASLSTESLRWVRPLQGIVAMLDEELIDLEIGDVRSGAATIGHRFHHPGPITLAGAKDYAEKLRACHVIVDQDERARLIRDGAAAAASAAGLTMVADEGLVEENAGLTEWPQPLLGRFDQAFLEVPREVIQLTMRTNQKYFACVGADGALAPAFICVANIAAADGGTRIVEGNQKVLAARLSDARFFWEQDLKIPLESQADKLGQIVFHEKLGTVADKVERVAKLARWLVEEGIVTSKASPLVGEWAGSDVPRTSEAVSGGHGGPDHGGGRGASAPQENLSAADAAGPHPNPSPQGGGAKQLATLAERAARLCKADLVTQMVGEFPELQGLIGGYLAEAQGEDPQVAAAIRDHYKPVGQGDDVPTDPVTVAVSLADKLDTLFGFFREGMFPTGSKDPFALRRAALGALRLMQNNGLQLILRSAAEAWPGGDGKLGLKVADFLHDRLGVQLRETGIRYDYVQASTRWNGGTDDRLDRVEGRARAIDQFLSSVVGKDLLAGYKRAANILKKEEWPSSSSPLVGEDRGGGPAASAAEKNLSAADAAGPHPNPSPQGGGASELSYSPETAETALIAALDSAEPEAAAAVEREDFEGAMRALATLRGPVDAFFNEVIVNDPDEKKREARLNLLARIRGAVHRVADFSRIEG